MDAPLTASSFTHAVLMPRFVLWTRRRGKSYADRVQSRKRASQKRKRAIDAIVAAGGDEPLRAPKTKKGGAAASKRGKGAAASRRGTWRGTELLRWIDGCFTCVAHSLTYDAINGVALDANVAYAAAAAAGGKPRATKKRKSAAKTPAASGSARGRRASAPSVYQGISHYDTSGVDFGDVSTMAWEGVGSAGYL